MSFDTLIMKAITDELAATLTGASLQRVTEPGRGEITLHFYHHKEQLNLHISIESKHARVHLAAKPAGKKQAKEQPSPFCMLLRKYLVGSKASLFSNPPLERILEIDFEPADGMPRVKLICEIMSRRSNIILVDDRGFVLGAARTVSWEKNPARAILPGEIYRPVPKQGKLNPTEMNSADFVRKFEEQIAAGKKPEQALYSVVEGIGPLSARELLYRSAWGESQTEQNIQKLYRETVGLFNASGTRSHKPVMLPDHKIYAATQLTHLPQEKQQEYDSANKMLDHFYSSTIREEKEKALKEHLHSTVEKRVFSLEKKLEEQKKDLLAAKQAPQYRIYGDLLLAYGHTVDKGADSATFPDLYNPEETIRVPLDPSKTAGTNAQRYFNRYRKAKKGRSKVQKQLNITGQELKYVRELLYSVESSSGESLREIKEELIDVGYLKDKSRGLRRKEALPQPLIFKTSSNRTIMIGRNNRQNDYITFKAAVRRDTWFHVREQPGGHVVLKEVPYPPPPEDIEEAAFLAAYFSKARDSRAADIDYTEVRHVRRRPGAKPGFVFYENFKTITVNPREEELLKRFNLLP